MDDKELGRLLRMSQGITSADQNAVLASHFGLVAAELLVARKREDSLKSYLSNGDLALCDPHAETVVSDLKELLGYD